MNSKNLKFLTPSLSIIISSLILNGIAYAGELQSVGNISYFLTSKSSSTATLPVSNDTTVSIYYAYLRTPTLKMDASKIYYFTIKGVQVTKPSSEGFCTLTYGRKSLAKSGAAMISAVMALLGPGGGAFQTSDYSAEPSVIPNVFQVVDFGHHHIELVQNSKGGLSGKTSLEHSRQMVLDCDPAASNHIPAILNNYFSIEKNSPDKFALNKTSFGTKKTPEPLFNYESWAAEVTWEPTSTTGVP